MYSHVVRRSSIGDLLGTIVSPDAARALIACLVADWRTSPSQANKGCLPDRAEAQLDE